MDSFGKPEWLLLRGTFDERTLTSIHNDDDLYIQLLSQLAGNSIVEVFYYYTDYKNKELPVFTKTHKNIVYNYGTSINGRFKYIVSRGAFGWQSDILKQHPEAYKIRYSSGKRYMPEPDINYNLILVDTEAQKQSVLKQYPKANVHLFIKPAASHFKPVECEKEYDVCYIANQQQAKIKGTKWVYDTVPRNLKVLHLGYIDEHITPPSNVTRKRVDRIDMPSWISKCRVGVVPYDRTDSAPRALIEMHHCRVDTISLDTVNFNWDLYPSTICGKDNFWKLVCELIKSGKTMPKTTEKFIHCERVTSLEASVEYLNALISGKEVDFKGWVGNKINPDPEDLINVR